MSNPAIFFVLHQIIDPQAWGKVFESVFDVIRDKTVEEAMAEPVFGGHKVLLSVPDEESQLTFCLWKCKPGTTLAQFHTFIDQFTGPASKNFPKLVETMYGAAQMDEHVFMKDSQKLATQGTTQGFAGQGDLWFVRHHIVDQAKWDAFFADTFDRAAKTNNGEDLKVAFKWRAGYQCLLTAGLDDNQGAFCVWEAPKNIDKEEFQDMVDNFTKGSKNAPVYKINKSMAINVNCLNYDYYVQDFLAAAKASQASSSPKSTAAAAAAARSPLSLP